MRTSRRMRMLVALVVTALTAGAFLLLTVGASADHGNGELLSATLAPSQPADPPIDGVNPGGLPWVLARGGVELRSDGEIEVSIRGLVIPVAHGTFPAGTALPVTTVSASLYCNSSVATATTTAVPISPAGDASIEDRIALPTTCLAPVVLVHPNGNPAAYIAATGWRS
jgi:hypothetical protein